MIKKYAILTLILSLITTQSYGIFDKETILQKINDIKNMWSSYRYLFVADAEEKTEKDYEQVFVQNETKRFNEEFRVSKISKEIDNEGCYQVLGIISGMLDPEKNYSNRSSRSSLRDILVDIYRFYNVLIQKRLDDSNIAIDIKEQFKNAQNKLHLGDTDGFKEIIAPLLIDELSAERKEEMINKDSWFSASIKVFDTCIDKFPELETLRDLEKEKELHLLNYVFKYCQENGYYTNLKDFVVRNI